MKKCDAKCSGTIVGIVIFVLLVAAVIYFFTSTQKGKDVSKKMSGTAKDIGNKITKEIEKRKTLSRKKYDEIVDKIVDEYSDNKTMAKNVQTGLKKELKKQWKYIQTEVKK